MKADGAPDPLLHLLRHYYGERWSIRRTARLWIATTTDDTARHAPTLIEEDLEAFVRQLENPPAGAGRSAVRQGDAVEAGLGTGLPRTVLQRGEDRPPGDVR